MSDDGDNSSSSSKGHNTLLSKPYGVYSFFNGLAPDNLFFHGVVCYVVKLQLSKLGLDPEFLTCQMTAPPDRDTADANGNNVNKTWEGIRRKYWHGRDVYYLPRSSWNQEFLGRKTKKIIGDTSNDNGVENDTTSMMMTDDNGHDGKRQRR